MKKVIIRLLAVAGFLIVLSISLNRIYETISWKETQDGRVSSTLQFYRLEKNTVDVLFLGSSHVYCDIYPEYLWESQGISSFDMAVSAMLKDESIHYLKEALKTQRPRVVCVETYGALFEDQINEFNDHRLILSLKPSFNSWKMVYDVIEDREARKDFLFRWSLLHGKYKEYKKDDFYLYGPNTFGKGSRITFDRVEIEYPEAAVATEDRNPLNDKTTGWVDELEKMSEEYGFSLVFFAAPYSIDENSQRTINALGDYVSAKGIDFFDFTKKWQELDLSVETDFCDAEHMNAYGAKKLTDWFCSYLSDNYSLNDHRGDGDYSGWETDYAYFINQRSYSLLEDASPEKKAEILAGMSNICIAVSLENGWDVEKDKYVQFFETLGISAEQFENGGKWIIKNGEIRKVLENVEGLEPVYETLGRYDTLRLSYDAKYDNDDIMLNMVGETQYFYYVTVLVYDLMLEEKILVFGF